MRLKRPPFFSFICILLVGLLASKPLSAQKKFSLTKIHFGMPHFKPLFKKDSTNKTFNPNHWFKYKKEQPNTKNENAMPIAVGYTDFDENIRDLQLLGKLPADNSLTIRPYILPKTVTYDSLLKAIDPSIVNNGHLVHKKHFDLQLLPVNFLQKYNSHHPYGWNDGPLSFSKGYQYLVSGGVYMHWRNIHLTLRPEYFHTASENYEKSDDWGNLFPSLNKLILGQSSIQFKFKPISFGFGTNNHWLGPGIYSSLILSNNAEGFQYFEVKNNNWNLFLGSLNFKILGGKLTRLNNQGFENANLNYKNNTYDLRYLNTITISFNPYLFKNLNFFFNRVFHTVLPTERFSFDKYIPVVTRSLFRNQYRDDLFPIDQILSFGTRYIFTQSNSEIYFEYGLNDGSSNLRELNLDLSHSSAIIFGINSIKKLNSKGKFIKSTIEISRLAQTPSYILRNSGNWYEHNALFDGYTNNNQILGSGAGFGNNYQIISFRYGSNINNLGIKFQHLEQNPIRLVGNVGNLWLGNTKWNDFSYGVQSNFSYKKIIFKLSAEWINSINYMWKDNNNKNNLNFTLNSIFLW